MKIHSTLQEDGGTVNAACEEVKYDETGIPCIQIDEMKSAEMSKSYHRVSTNGIYLLVLTFYHHYTNMWIRLQICFIARLPDASPPGYKNSASGDSPLILGSSV